ncbi:hypothetical protein BH10BAC2_BH10BAC2_00410 [soil metagenome]
MPENTMGSAKMGFLLYDSFGGKVGGAIVHNPDFYTPSENGSLIYLNCQPDLQIMLNRVNDAGGQTMIEKKEVASGLGFWALIKDTEGNRVALHSME